MKKLILSLFLVMGVSFVVKAADQRGTPRTVTGEAVALPGFIGVSYATSNFSLATTTATYSTETVRGVYTVFGVNFSTGNCGSADFVDLFDSTNTLESALSPTLRLYNVNGSTSGSTANGSACSGFSGPLYPVRFNTGLLFKPNTAAYNNIMLLYYKEGDE